MLCTLTLLFALFAVATTAREEHSSSSIACSRLNETYPSQLFYPDTAAFTYEAQSQFWSSTLHKTPKCIFVPQDAKQMSFAVTTLTLTSTQFAVRGGGHMPIPGFNSIESGVLLSTSNLTSLNISENKSLVSVGAGARWRDVYSYLAPCDLAAVGGRVGDVGVSGFLLGGGISFHSSQYGFGSDNVVSFECVLSNGVSVNADATNDYSDLFWALKGGGNSICIVTKFVIRTVESSQVWIGIAQYEQSQSIKYLDAVYNFGRYGANDVKAAMIPIILSYPGMNTTVYAAAKFYDSVENGNKPKAFENFTSPVMTPTADSFALQPLSTYIQVTDALQPSGLRQTFRVMSSIVHREAVQYVHDVFLSENHKRLANIDGLSVSVTFQPVTRDLIEQGINNGGNPQGVDTERAPYFWMVENWTWLDELDDIVIETLADTITDEIEAGLAAMDAEGGFHYLNDAGKGQPVFQSYPPDNLARLKEICRKYDPMGVYTKLMPGGWKVLDA